MSIPKRGQTVLQWKSTLGWMRAAGTRVRVTCTRRQCSAWSEVDVVEMIRVMGSRDATLWDCQPPCEFCGRPAMFLASPGSGTPFRPMLSPNLSVRELPMDAWVVGWFGLDNRGLTFPPSPPVDMLRP